MKMVLVTVYHIQWVLMDIILIQTSVLQVPEKVPSNGRMMIETPQTGQILSLFSFSLLMQQMLGTTSNNQQDSLLMHVKKVQKWLLWIHVCQTQQVWLIYGFLYGQEQKRLFIYTLPIESLMIKVSMAKI